MIKTMLENTESEDNAGTFLALGSFDGLHLGHMEVLESALKLSREKGLRPSVMLFDRHPAQVLFGKAPPQLMSDAEKEETLKKMGFAVVRERFSRIKDLPPETFLEEIYTRLGVRGIACGFNFRFGKNGAGTTADLSEFCGRKGIALSIADPVIFNGEPVSSTRIRSELENGNVQSAALMLGRRFAIEAEVVRGDGRGTEMGFPTANQFIFDGSVCPKFGVYAAETEIDGKTYPVAVNIGIRPTIKTETLISESFIIGYSGDLYGRRIRISLIEYVRPESDFGSIDRLKNQLALDIKTILEIYNKDRNNG